MIKCWEEEPKDRPAFVKLKDTMKEMERNHKVSSAYVFIQLASCIQKTTQSKINLRGLIVARVLAQAYVSIYTYQLVI